MNMSSPTMAFWDGKKYTEPTMNEILPIAINKARREPILSNGLSGLNYGSRQTAIMSHAKKKAEPMIKSMPPTLGSM